MSISVQGRVGWASIPNALGRSKLPHPTIHLLINLLTHSEGFDAGYSLIQQQTGMAPATIANAIKNLEKLGLVTVSKKKGQNGQFSSNHYTFHADRLWRLTPEFVDERLRSNGTASDNEVGTDTASVAEVGTASGAEAVPLQELKRKNDQGETSPKNDQCGASAPVADAPSPAPRAKQAHELPENWMPAPHVIEQMQEECPTIDLEAETRKFRDYWPAQPGAKSRKKDWNATWRNWIRNARSAPVSKPRESPAEMYSRLTGMPSTPTFDDPNVIDAEPDNALISMEDYLNGKH